MPKKEKAKFTASESPAIDRTGKGDQHAGSFPAGHSGERASFVKGKGSGKGGYQSKAVMGKAASGDSGRKTKPVVHRAR